MSISQGNATEIGSNLKKIRNGFTRKIAPHFAKLFPNFFEHQLKQPIFVLGCHRSGTTLLGRLLDMHKDIANWTEANEIWDPIWFPWNDNNRNRAPLEYDPYNFTNEWWLHNQSRLNEIKSVFGAYQFLYGKSFFMNKSPYNVFRLPQLKKHFPSARFVYIIRDGRAVVNSHTKKLISGDHIREWPKEQQQKFEASDTALAEQLAKYWRLSIEEVEKQNKNLNLEAEELLYTTTYQKLCDDPVAILYEICDFIGLDKNRFIDGFTDQKINNSNHKWKKDMTDETKKQIAKIMESKLIEYGYPV